MVKMPVKKSNKSRFSLYEPFIGKLEKAYVNDCLNSKWISSRGKYGKLFEDKFKSFIKIKYAVAVCNGTAALHVALLALGIGEKDEVITPTFTYIATANSINYVGASVKFVDSKKTSWQIDEDKISNHITSKTRAVLVPHIYGQACEMNKIKQICKKNKLFLIEDCAEAFGTKIKGVSVGTFGQMSIFSFAPNKILTTGEGGAICTDSRKIFEKLQLIRSHGRLINENYFKTSQSPNYISIGYNWRMSSMTAALGLSQFDKLDRIIQLRRRHARFYVSKLKKINEIKLPDEPKDHLHVYQLFTIQLKNNLIRHKLQKFLASKGIMTKVFFEPIHLSKFYKKSGFGKKSLSNTEKISRTVLSLPIFPGLKSEEITHICDSIKEFFQN